MPDPTPKSRRRWFAWIGSFIPCLDSREWEIELEMSSRPLMDDETFYDTYYGKSGIQQQIPVRLRTLFAVQLGKPWKHLVPTDKVEDVYPDLGFEELVFEAEEEFGIQVGIEEIQQLDGTFDSLVRLIATKLRDGQTDSSSATPPS